MPNKTVKNGQKAKKVKLPEMIFFLEKQLIKFSRTYWPFSFSKISKKFLWGCDIFRPKMAQTKFFWKIIIILIYLLASFIVQNFKQILPADPELWGCAIFGTKMVHFPKWEFFFRKTVNEHCSFHSYRSTTQKSKSDINLLVKYWRLKNTGISLSESHFWL